MKGTGVTIKGQHWGCVGDGWFCHLDPDGGYMNPHGIILHGTIYAHKHS